MFRWLRRDPKHLVERRQSMARALAGYPPYEPPHRQGPNFVRRRPDQSEVEHETLELRFTERANENFSYFMQHREERMVALSTFLAKFDVKMGLDDAGLAAVSAWCPGHFGSLAANLGDTKTRQIFLQMLQPWTDQWLGLNVIFDLGIFLGEAIIAKRPRLHWIYQPGISDDGLTYLSGYDLRGFRNPKTWLDPMRFIFEQCSTDEADLRTKGASYFVRADELVGKVRDFSAR